MKQELFVVISSCHFKFIFTTRFLNGSNLYRNTVPHFLLANYIRIGRSTSNIHVKYNARVLNQINWNKVYQVFSFGNKHLKLLLPNVTVFRVWIIRSFFLLFTLFLLLNNSLMNKGLKIWKISKVIVLSLRTSVEHLSEFFRKVL